MNELSWLIYLAGVVGNIGFVAVTVAIVSGLVASGCAIFGAIVTLEGYNDEDRQEATKAFSICKKTAVICVSASLLAAIIPSSNTIYAIAASEMGERVIKSETGGKALEALNAWLDRQIAGTDTKQVDPS